MPKGSVVCTSFADIEGMTAWRTSTVKRYMFDPFLYGHEGVELTVRISQLYGLEAFLYDPRACLMHDYSTPSDVMAKEKRNLEMQAYLLAKSSKSISLRQSFYKFSKEEAHWSFINARAKVNKILRSALNSSVQTVSVITTAFNSGHFIEDYAEAWKRQTDTNFHITFVDDGSTDNTLELAKHHLKGLPHMIVEAKHKGRGAALNVAVQSSLHDWCIVADADDIPTIDRVEMARRAISTHPTKTAFGFTIFDDNTYCRGSRPIISRIQPIEPRFFIGMPSPFPSFVFKSSALKLPFSEELPSGIDYDWLFRNFQAGSIRGYCFPYNVCYYRVHSGQITQKFRKNQSEKSREHTKTLHASVIGSDIDPKILSTFLGWELITNEKDLKTLQEYASVLVREVSDSNLRELSDDLEELCWELMAFYSTRVLSDKLGWNRREHAKFKEAYVKADSENIRLKEKVDIVEKKLRLNRAARVALAEIISNEGL